ncbi:MAG: caspase family protein [Desulfobacteraceae bacterium]|nr:caspase family protein [Desulfobacteraceae bacterium]
MSKHNILWSPLLLLSIIFLIPHLSFSAQESRTALVIGNGSYESAQLRNSVNDARDMTNALRSLGFTVIYKQNAKQRDMEKAIRNFGKRLRKHGGIGLFYYAGHGMQINGRNYLIPVDAEIETESDVGFEAVDAGRVLGKMEDAGNDLNIVILDACRDNPFARIFRSVTQGLARMDAPTGTIVAYATAPGSVAADGMNKNGLYTSMLLKHMTTPGLRIEEFFKRVRIDVMNESGTKQVPWESSSLTGDFYFNPARGIAVLHRPTLKEKGSAVQRKKRREEKDKDVAIIHNFILADGQSDMSLRGLLMSIFSQHSTKFKLSSSNSTSDSHDILIRGKVLGVTRDRIVDKEAQEAQQGVAIMKSLLKSIGDMSGDKKTPFSNIEIPVQTGENKTLVKVRVLISASYVNDDGFYSQTAVATKTVSEDKADAAVTDLTFEATRTAGSILSRMATQNPPLMATSKSPTYIASKCRF